MRVNQVSRRMLVILVAATAAAAVVGFAGASQSRAAGAALPELNQISPLNARGEESIDRSNSQQHGKSKKHNGVATPVVNPTQVSSGSNATPGQSFEGTSMWDQRTLNGFYLEPPDQGMCASTNPSVGTGGRVLEAVNDVVAVYDSAGSTLTEETLNQFFGYNDLLAGGPELTDPSCYYDEETGAWFVTVLTLDVDHSNPAAGPLGPSRVVTTSTSP